VKRFARKIAGVLALLFAFISVAALAQQSQPLAKALRPIPYRQDQPVSSTSLTGMVAAIVLLAAGGFAAVRYGAKRGVRVPLRGLRNERLKLVEVLHLSGRTRLYLVEADGQRMLVGDHQNNLNIQPLGAVAAPTQQDSEALKN
jgi:flagellar biogenesis protein FliO